MKKKNYFYQNHNRPIRCEDCPVAEKHGGVKKKKKERKKHQQPVNAMDKIKEAKFSHARGVHHSSCSERAWCIQYDFQHFASSCGMYVTDPKPIYVTRPNISHRAKAVTLSAVTLSTEWVKAGERVGDTSRCAQTSNIVPDCVQLYTPVSCTRSPLKARFTYHCGQPSVLPRRFPVTLYIFLKRTPPPPARKTDPKNNNNNNNKHTGCSVSYPVASLPPSARYQRRGNSL